MHVRQPGIILFTEHYAQCVAFYRDLLQLPTLFEQRSLICLALGNAYLMIEAGGIGKSGEKMRQENPCVLRFNVDDVHVAAQELRAQGVDVQVLIFDWGTIGVFLDPDGNRCELKDHWE